MWKITNELVIQVLDLAGKVTSLEEEKERSIESTKKLVRTLKEKMTALEEKEKEWATRGDEVARLEAKADQLRSWEITPGGFYQVGSRKSSADSQFWRTGYKSAAAHIGKPEVQKSLMSEYPLLRLRKQNDLLGSICKRVGEQAVVGIIEGEARVPIPE